MKHRSILRIFSVIATLALLLLAIPASSVMAAASITVNPNEGGINDEITVNGTSFQTDREVWIIFSSQNVNVGNDIDDEVTKYQVIGTKQTNAIVGSFSIDVDVPEDLAEGDDVEAVHGGFYYIYVTYGANVNIEAKAAFLVTGFAELNIDDEEGFVGDVVRITGEGFIDDEDIIVKYDNDDVTDDIDGDATVDNNGEVDFDFTIPDSIAGDHTITVSDETGNKGEVTFTVEPKLVLSKTSGPPGTVLIVNGTGFGNRADFDTVRFGTLNILSSIGGVYRTSSDGSFTFTYTVPTTLVTGNYILTLEDEDGNEAEATFIVQQESAIDKTTGSVGETLTITGTGFTAGTAISVTYGGTAVTLSVSNIDTSGNLTAQFSAPASTAGAHNIVLTVGTHTKTFVFTMESVAPGAPQLLLPLTGEKAKQPITFDWGDVTDPSGVTYTLWISNVSDFATLIVEKTGLTDSSYTMTEAEKLASVSKDAPYYWSVRAVDNAGNIGAWATSATLTVGFAFNWPTWAWWVVGGMGGVLLILLFFWMGRRSITY